MRRDAMLLMTLTTMMWEKEKEQPHKKKGDEIK